MTLSLNNCVAVLLVLIFLTNILICKFYLNKTASDLIGVNNLPVR
jgi:hypothetical protein